MYIGSASSSLKEGRAVAFESRRRLSAIDAGTGLSLLAAGEGNQLILGDAKPNLGVSNAFSFKE